jgi:hypothetical protein
MAGQHPDLAALDPGADAVPVDLDFVQPRVALGRALDKSGELGADEIRKRVGGAAGIR